MATTPTPAPAPKENKFESFLSKFGTFIKDFANVAVNVGEQELPVIVQLLPPAASAGVVALMNYAATQVAAVDAKYAAIGSSNIPFAAKVAEAVAVGGVGALAIAAQAGLKIDESNLNLLFSAAGQAASVLNFTGVTSTPIVPTTTTAATAS